MIRGRLWVWILLVPALASLAPGQDKTPTPSLTAWLDNGREIRSALEHLVAPLRPHVVEVRSEGSSDDPDDDRERGILGILVEPEWVLTKSSEVGGHPAVLSFDGERRTAVVHRRDAGTDLALLRVPGLQGSPLTWSESPVPVGTILLSVGPRSTPLDVSVASWDPRPIPVEKGGATLGIQGKDPSNGGPGGVEVTGVRPDGPAAQAGIGVGDVILRLGQSPVADLSGLQEALTGHEPGDWVILEVGSRGKTVKVWIELGAQAEEGPRHAADVDLRLSERRSGFRLGVRHDATISYALCGGPVLSLDGQVVGVNIARSGRTQCVMLPASVVRAAVARMRE